MDVILEADDTADATTGATGGSDSDTGAGSTQAGASGSSSVDPRGCDGSGFGVLPGIYQFRSGLGGCLSAGEAITIRTFDALETIVAQNCDAGDAVLWDVAHPEQRRTFAFKLTNQASGWDLDVELGSTNEGTRLVLFEAHSALNQQFYLFGVDDYVMIAPAHVQGMCVTNMNQAVEIMPCAAPGEALAEAQKWQPVPDSCIE